MKEGRVWVVLVAIFVGLWFVGVACGSDEEEADDPRCENVGSYSCFDNVVHWCRLDDAGVARWRAKEDCNAGDTANCQCVILGDAIGECTEGGVRDMDLSCHGASLD